MLTFKKTTDIKSTKNTIKNTQQSSHSSNIEGNINKRNDRESKLENNQVCVYVCEREKLKVM